jgi:hypothetical protein
MQVFMEQAPDAKYWDDNDRQRRCVWLCAALGLHYLGFTNLAEQVSALNYERIGVGEEPLQAFERVVSAHSTKEERRLFQICHLGKRMKNKWNMLTSPKKYRMCVLGVKSSDSKTDHAICIVQDWIFDSNFRKALPLTQESLDLCCSSADTETNFKGTVRGVMLNYRPVTFPQN